MSALKLWVVIDSLVELVADIQAPLVATARTFTFPLWLGLLVVVYLVLQARLDAQDPKLAAAGTLIDDDEIEYFVGPDRARDRDRNHS